MPRDFDSDFDSDAAARGEMALRFTENVDCPHCGVTFEGVFHAEGDSVEDIVEPPIGEQDCPACGHHFVSELTGWTFYTEAG